ncbi:TetR/AcrR family transcriptional regulator [Thalassotalea atypica]|uniref:TetR/AcrR family transcriptional regulator n=1 Tax=Thalassotalea atypica TaxID=2054316 RepID=UPI0025734D5D|nr:TetR/AcrR family transcriptional regulator [Thalassotalea atypica]
MVYRATEKTKARKEAKRLALIEQAVAQIQLGGFNHLTMESLAQAAGIAVGTVYKYFESKAALCQEVFILATEKEVSIIADIAKEKGSARLRLEKAIVTFSRRAMHAQKQAYALIFEPVHPNVERERLKYRAAYAVIFEQVIQEGIINKEFVDQSSSLAATAIVGIIAEVLIRPLSQPIAEEREAELLDQIRQFCLRAIVVK